MNVFGNRPCKLTMVSNVNNTDTVSKGENKLQLTRKCNDKDKTFALVLLFIICSTNIL